MNIELRLHSVMLKTGNFGPIIRGEITRDHFATEEGKMIYDLIVNYRHMTEGAAQFPSLAIVRDRFGTGIELPEPDPGDNVDNLAVEVRLHVYRAELRKFAVEAEQIADGSVDPIEALVPVMARLRKATEAQQRVQHASLATALPTIMTQYKQKEILPEGIPFPWPSLTKASRGIHRREFTVIAGRPKSRKTFTALRVVCHAVKHFHCRALIFSPEMPVRQMMLRSIAHLADLPYAEFKDGTMAEAEEMRLLQIAETYGRTNNEDDTAYQLSLAERIPGLGDANPSLDIVQSTGRDTNWLVAQIEQYRPDIVLVDSFYRQKPPGGKKNDSDWKTLTSVSRDLKDMAMETGVCMIGTHQLNREAQRSLGDINNIALADAIGQDADAVYRVVTGRMDGKDVSALYSLGARDINTEGVMIMNRPCYDYSEIGAIANRKQVIDLMKQEEEELAKDEKANARPTTSASPSAAPGAPPSAGKGPPIIARRPKHTGAHRRGQNSPVHKAGDAFSAALDDDFKRMMEE